MMLRITLLQFYLSLTFLVSPALLAQVENSVSQSHHQPLSKAISDELNLLYQNRVFSGSVFISLADEVVIENSYGYQDKTLNKLNTSSTVSDIGSIAKTFTAAAVLQLIQREKLQLDTKLSELFSNCPDDKQNITIKNLLSHHSGLDNFHNDSDFDEMDKNEALEEIFDLNNIAKQEEKIAYSNAAYTLLAIIVENISKQPFQQYVHENLLIPLGLKNTGFYGDKSITLNTVAKGYGGDDDGDTTFEKTLTWALIGAGGMVASIDDLNTWFSVLLAPKSPIKGVTDLMRQKVNDKWLLGNLRHFNSWGTLAYYAGGSTDYGYTAAAVYLPKYDAQIVLLLNGYDRNYRNRVHQKMTKEHILPILLKHLK